jgi:hypothetical protein
MCFHISVMNTHKSSFLAVTASCPGTPACSGSVNGACVQGECICLGNWSGPACNTSEKIVFKCSSYKNHLQFQIIVPIVVSVHVSNSSYVAPTIYLSAPLPQSSVSNSTTNNSSSSVQFDIAIVSISEIEDNGIVVQFVNFSNVQLNYSTSSTDSFQVGFKIS